MYGEVADVPVTERTCVYGEVADVLPEYVYAQVDEKRKVVPAVAAVC